VIQMKQIASYTQIDKTELLVTLAQKNSLCVSYVLAVLIDSTCCS